jgi:hypothetical protein
MNTDEKLQLSKLIQANNTENQTSLIRELKHSHAIQSDVLALNKLKIDYSRLSQTNKSQFEQMAINKAHFLFNNYTDIFNKVMKDEIDMNILGHFIMVLRKIEDGQVDQHEASFEIGKVLKSMYIDSALKKSDKLDKKRTHNKKELSKPVKKISWKQFKATEVNN